MFYKKLWASIIFSFCIVVLIGLTGCNATAPVSTVAKYNRDYYWNSKSMVTVATTTLRLSEITEMVSAL
jgi:hypothetical protein